MNREPLSILLFNQSWLAEELRALGHRVYSVGCRDHGFDICLPHLGIRYEDILKALPGDFVPDRIVYFDNSSGIWFTGLEDISIPTVFYSVDTHHHFEWHSFFSTLFDCSLVAQRDYMRFLTDPHPDRRWFPLWSPRNSTPESEKSIDVCFRGTLDPEMHPNRIRFCEKVAEIVPFDYATGDYEAPYCRSKIVINEVVSDDLNFRVFEALMCGALLITPRIDHGFSELFEAGKDCVVYERGDAQQAAELAKYYLEHDDERIAIAARGREKVLQYHSTGARAKQLTEILYSLTPQPKPMRFLTAARSYLNTAAMLRKVGAEYSLPFIEQAGVDLQRSAAARESCDGNFVAAIVLCRYCYEELGLHEESSLLLHSARAAYPEELILALTQTERLLALGEMEAAHQLAAEISQRPQELLDSASRLLGDVKARIASELSRWDDNS